MTGPQSKRLQDGRLWLHHGPIDLFIAAYGASQEVALAYQAAEKTFQQLLSQIVEELPGLRKAVGNKKRRWKYDICQRMEDACFPFNESFITPMAAVAGSVADTINAAMILERNLEKTYVNNGGDIAVYLSAGNTFSAAIAENPKNSSLAERLQINAASPVRGVATSGRGGRSFSLGIADAVTVLAKNAALADAAATLIANAVDTSHPTIQRERANTIDPDSDLGDKWVTVEVGELPLPVLAEALENGIALARHLHPSGLIQAAYLSLQGERRIFSPQQETALSFAESESF